MIFTSLAFWRYKLPGVQTTWATKCDYALYFHTKSPDVKIKGAVPLSISEGRGNLTRKTLAALDYTYKNYADNVDWFLKADDDSFIIMDNLRSFLSNYDPLQKLYLGHVDTHYSGVKHGYNSGGAGYLLSKPAAALIVHERQTKPDHCKPDGFRLDKGQVIPNCKFTSILSVCARNIFSVVL